jgi:hypothetical protein
MLDGEQRQASVCIKRLARDRLSQGFPVLADLECEIEHRGDYGNSTDKFTNAAKALKSHGSPPNKLFDCAPTPRRLRSVAGQCSGLIGFPALVQRVGGGARVEMLRALAA